jgi:hypothetical protein
MSERPEPDPEPDPDPDKPTIAPFAGALAIIVLVVIGIFVFNSFTNAEPAPEQQVGQAIVGQNDAMQRQDYPAFQVFTCRSDQGTQDEFLAGQRDSVSKSGERYVDDVADITIDGDRATAEATYSFGGNRDAKSTADVTLVHEDGAWKVCPAAVG